MYNALCRIDDSKCSGEFWGGLHLPTCPITGILFVPVSSHLLLLIYYTLLMSYLLQSHWYDVQISLNNVLDVVHISITIKLARHTNLAR